MKVYQTYLDGKYPAGTLSFYILTPGTGQVKSKATAIFLSLIMEEQT
jgi:hypothetical protein